jgi:hypothetical protein
MVKARPCQHQDFNLTSLQRRSQAPLSKVPPCYLNNSVDSTTTSLFSAPSSLLSTNTTTLGNGAATTTATNAVAPGRGEAKPAIPAKTSQEADNSATSTTGLRPSEQTKEERKGGSIRNARNGIESRQKLEVSLPSPPHPTMLRSLSLTDDFLALEPAGLR